MKRLLILIIILLLTLSLPGCQSSQPHASGTQPQIPTDTQPTSPSMTQPSVDVPPPETQPVQPTQSQQNTSLIPEGTVTAVRVTSMPEGYNFSFTEKEAEKIAGYFRSLNLISDFEENPDEYSGMTWCVTLEYETGKSLVVYHFGNMFVRSEDGPWYRMTYEEASALDTLIWDLSETNVPEPWPEPENNPEFWITENVDGVDFSLYQEKYGTLDGKEYYGTGYTPTVDEFGQHIDPEQCVIYTVTSYPGSSNKEQYITGIRITDPNVSFCGISLNSSFEEFLDIMEAQEFSVIRLTEELCAAQKDDCIVYFRENEILIEVNVDENLFC